MAKACEKVRQCIKCCRDILSLPYSKKEGFGVFSALAGFAVAQSVALTAVAKGEQREYIVLSIYFLSVLGTSAWIIILLLMTRVESPDEQQPPRMVRAFDHPTTIYGYCTLFWTVFVAGIMLFLAFNGLLPNQTTRVAYLKTDVIAKAKYFTNVGQGELGAVGGNRFERQSLDIWTTWLRRDVPEKPDPPQQNEPESKVKRRLVWIEQSAAFEDNYKTFTAKLDIENPNFAVAGRCAFLVSSDGGSARPIYRQLQFEMTASQDYTPRFDVVTPSADETLVVIAYVAKKGDKDFPKDPSEYKFRIVKD